MLTELLCSLYCCLLAFICDFKVTSLLHEKSYFFVVPSDMTNRGKQISRSFLPQNARGVSECRVLFHLSSREANLHGNDALSWTVWSILHYFHYYSGYIIGPRNSYCIAIANPCTAICRSIIGPKPNQ